jgi:hypothetical protein
VSGTLLFKCIISFRVYNDTTKEIGILIIPVLEIKKLRIKRFNDQNLNSGPPRDQGSDILARQRNSLPLRFFL